MFRDICRQDSLTLINGNHSNIEGMLEVDGEAVFLGISKAQKRIRINIKIA